MPQHAPTPRSPRTQQLKRTEHPRYTSFKDLGLASPEQEDLKQCEKPTEGQGGGPDPETASRAGKWKEEQEEKEEEGEGCGRRREGEGKGKEGKGKGGMRPRSASARWMEWLVGPRGTGSPP